MHITLGEQPHYVFFSRRAPRQVPCALPSYEENVDDTVLDKAHKVIQQTHLEMARKYRRAANRKRRTESVEEGSLVWVRNETITPGTSRKLNPRDGAKYKLQNLFDDTVIERTVDKIKPYIDDEKWLVEPQELTLDEPANVSVEVPPESAPSEVEPVGRPKRKVVPPPKLLEEM